MPYVRAIEFWFSTLFRSSEIFCLFQALLVTKNFTASVHPKTINMRKHVDSGIQTQEYTAAIPKEIYKKYIISTGGNRVQWLNRAVRDTRFPLNFFMRTQNFSTFANTNAPCWERIKRGYQKCCLLCILRFEEVRSSKSRGGALLLLWPVLRVRGMPAWSKES